MASVTKRPNGHHWVQFYWGGKRHTVRLGPVTPREAREFCDRLDRLLASASAGVSPDRGTLKWVMSLESGIHERISQAGLISARAVRSLGDLLDAIWEKLRVSSSTRASYGNVRANLIECFGAGKPVASFSQGDAADFRTWMRDRKYSAATISKRCKTAKQFFRFAVDREWVHKNPFRDMKGWADANEERRVFVPAAQVEAAIKECTHPELRLVFALARWGGVRVPSEVLSLRWEDVYWDRGMMRITAPKTAHQGKPHREVPIFPELKQHLDAVWDGASENAEFVIAEKRMSGSGYTGHLERACKRAGVVLWQKPFQNLRSTRETELLDRFPIHVVCAWIGNTPRVAQRHYLQVTDEHRRLAIGGEAKSEAIALREPEAKRQEKL